MQEKQVKTLGKFLSYVLRHHPGELGITLDANGWTNVDLLLEKLSSRFPFADMPTLEYLVATNSKKRFSFDETRTMIRANQGHSVAVDLGYVAQPPPPILYHGTAEQFVDTILKSGLQKQGRHHVHLSPDMETAMQVGRRHGKPVVLTIDAATMHRVGFEFFRSDNGVWLAESVPSEYIGPPVQALH